MSEVGNSVEMYYSESCLEEIIVYIMCISFYDIFLTVEVKKPLVKKFSPKVYGQVFCVWLVQQ